MLRKPSSPSVSPRDHRLLSALADVAFEPLLIADESRIVVLANRAACLLFGGHNPDDPDLAPDADLETLTGHHLADLIPGPELDDIVHCAFSGDGECPETQIPIQNRMFRARCLGVEHGGVHYMALTLQDITQLLQLNRARRDMVANISHELRTPISGIRLLIDTLTHQEPAKKQRHKVIRKINRELDTLQRIVEGMRDLSMIESGQAIMRLVETPILPLVGEALDSLAEQIERNRLAITTAVPADLYALADVAQIERVLTNLIHNAIKFTPKKGSIHVQAGPTPEDDTITVCISDSGTGIPPEERERVFERFYQIDSSRSTHRGSGLGLAIAKHIVGAHGGRMWIDDSPLGGTCLCFTLPAASPPPAPVEDETASPQEAETDAA